MPRRSITLSPAAVRDLDAIYAYSLDRFGREVADSYLNLIRAALEHVADYPQIIHAIESGPENERELPVRSHVIRFQFDDSSVRVIRVFHARADRASIRN